MSEPSTLAATVSGVVGRIGEPNTPRSAGELERRRVVARRQLQTPTRFRGAALDNFAVFGSAVHQATLSRAYAALRHRVAEYPTWTSSTSLMAFTGAPGAGKNRAAWAFCEAMIAQHAITARQLKVADLVLELRDAWNGGDTSERKALKYWRELDLLVINEVRARSFVGKVDQPLFAIIDDRMDWYRPTILINNDASLDEFFQLIGRDLEDRITGCDGGLIDFGQESYRQWDSAAVSHG